MEEIGSDIEETELSNKSSEIIKSIISLSNDLVDSKITNNASKYSTVFTKLMWLFLELKSSNRLIHTISESKRKEIENRKSIINDLQLKLDNLLYKQDYLINQINSNKIFDDSNTKAIELEIKQNIGINILLSNNTDMDDSDNQIANKITISQLYDLHNSAISILSKEKENREVASDRLSQHQSEYKLLEDLLDKKKKFLEDLPTKITTIKSNVLELQKDFLEIIPKDLKIEDEMDTSKLELNSFQQSS